MAAFTLPLPCAALSACARARPVTVTAAPIATTPKPVEASLAIHRTFPAFETSFRLPELVESPFAAEVWAEIDAPSGAVFWRPAFFDGDGVWRLRVTPVEPGHHRFELYVGPAAHRVPARVTELRSSEFDVRDKAEPGFVRRDAQRVQAFVLDDGSPYFPLGHNVAWAKPEEYEAIFSKMGAAGENWSRTWMAHWSGQNLDWNPRRPVALGMLDLDVARTWDRIVHAAEKNGIRVQLVLQHHGQYSTTTNPNWDENPYSKRNGGFLERPEDFFTDARARELTERKLRYAVARWGYSTAIMAWELFNEVEWTDAYKGGHVADVAAWHRDIATYLRSIDAYRHLVTTSSIPTDSPIYEGLDYFQPHVYSVNLIDALQHYGAPAASLDRPIFFGEMGYESVLPGVEPDPRAVHAALWAGLMSDGAGAAQYWFWQPVQRHDLYAHFGAIARFCAAARLPSRAMTRVPVMTRGEMSRRVVVSPASSEGRDRRTEFELYDDGRPTDGIDQVPVYLHGDRTLANDVTFRLNPKRVVAFNVRIDEIAKAGAGVEIRIDDRIASSKSWPAADRDRRVDEVISAKIPAGARTVRIRETGTEWVHVASYEFDGFEQPILRALGRATTGRDALMLWVYSRTGLDDPDARPTSGQVVVAGMARGRYAVSWWDTAAGKAASTAEASVASDGTLTLDTPAIALDAAALVTRQP